MHVDYILSIEELPLNCIRECSASGDVSEAVEFWRKELNFTVNREKAIQCLTGYGAWDDEQLAADDDETIARRILWLACGDFSEYQVGGDAAGSDTFVLE